MKFRPIETQIDIIKEARFNAANDIAQKMTLEELISLSKPDGEFNVGYDFSGGIFEIMVNIPINKLERHK